ncbi:FAD-binding domain-containing protein [Lentithecium fluviatile CBS 122367]|uniref:FAD-binding domain-containing protein n=1 Tax=Lentithecium fluviatile CBS 122367 TaxID=1168545 RepID=A0A6G1J4Y4_9PLEO|nr:FAD-binding domain-containing protein [Lentithecium fluviatile CBS 122367]
MRTTTTMTPIIRIFLGLGLLVTIVLGSPLPHSAIPEYFQHAPVTRGQLSVSQVQQELGSQLSKGSLIIGPDDPEWANVTKRYSTFSKPQDLKLVVKVNAESDVPKVVKYCNKNSINFMANNQGHGFTTTITKLSGIEINLSQLTNIKIQPNKKSAWFQGGTWGGNIIKTLWDQGFVTTTGSNECVGLMGPALGGGFGRYQGLYGLVSDNFVTLNVVLGDGRNLQVSKTSYPDLFWALKGAGHNFAIVTSAELNIYPRKIDTWHYHNYAWTQDKLETIFETLNRVQGNGTTPAKLAVNFGQVSLDPSYSKTEAIIGWTFAYMGSAAEGEMLLQPFNEIPALQSVQGDVSYEELLQVQGTGASDPTACSSSPLVGSSGLLQTWNVTSQREIYNLFNKKAVEQPDLAANARVFYECYSTLKTQAIDAASSAYPHRDEYLVYFFATVTPPGKEDQAHEWASQVRNLFNDSEPNRRVATYVNYATGDESLESIYGYEPWRLQKLRALKAKYDPKNAFRYYNPIIPA